MTISMDGAVLQWLKYNEGQFFESPRKEAFKSKRIIKGFIFLIISNIVSFKLSKLIL